MLKLFLLCLFLAPWEIAYQLERGVDYGGENIGGCGSYKTREDLEAACTADSTCIGYSTYSGANTAAVADTWGHYPWCLKKTKDRKKSRGDHNYYRKHVIKGNVISW